MRKNKREELKNQIRDLMQDEHLIERARYMKSIEYMTIAQLEEELRFINRSN